MLHRARRVAQPALEQDSHQRFVVGRRGQTVLHHDVSRGEHRVARPVVEACLMAQQLLHGDVEIARILYHVRKHRVIKYSLRAEYAVGQLQHMVLHQLHYTHSREQLRHGGKPHHVVRLHLQSALLVRPSEALRINQRIVARDGYLRPVQLPPFEISFQRSLHFLEIRRVRHVVSQCIIKVSAAHRLLFLFCLSTT